MQAWLVLVGLAGCGDQWAGTPPDAAIEPRCTPTSFAPAAQWRLPFAVPRLSDADHLGVDWGLVDLDGDGRRDLVVTYDDASLPVGTTRWRFHQNTGAGFADATVWAVPLAADKLSGDTDGRVWTLDDFTDDGKPDLVLLEIPSDSRVGAERWNVYVNLDNHFNQKLIAWSLPFPIWQLEDQDGVGRDHVVFDIDGDGWRDLVVTSDTNAGETAWQVYRGTGGGFAGTPTPWSLPFPARRIQDSDHVALDLDGDGRIDLVQLRDAADPKLGTDSWRVWLNTGVGFGAAMMWPLPFPASTLHDTAGVVRNYSTFDLDADQRPDLVVSLDATDVEAGATRWNLLRNTGAGFATTPAYWGIQFPASLLTQLDDMGRDWATFDLNGDGFSDIVLPLDDTDAQVGASYWSWYGGACL